MSAYKLLSNLDSEDEDVQNLFRDIPIGIHKSDGNNSFSPLVGGNRNLSSEKDGVKYILDKVESGSENDDLEFKLCRIEKFIISKSLFTFRIAQFLWYGAGALPGLFIGIFMKQRGLTLVEISSIYSVIFIFQITSSSITGIIADKIGNAKPILIFLMLATSFTLVLILLTPNINSTKCTLQRNISNKFNEPEYTKNFSLCFKECFFNNNNMTLREKNYSQNSQFKNASTVELIVLNMNNSKNFCSFLSIKLVNASVSSSKDYCCNECINSTKFDCITERNGYLVAVYATLILVFFSVNNPAFRFMNITAVALAEKNKSDFGKELVFALSGGTFVVIIVAVILNINKESESVTNYDSIISISVGVIICAVLPLFITTVPVFPPGKNMLKSAFSIMKDIDILAFILLVFVAGTGFSFTMTLRLIFFESMNASRTLVTLHSVLIFLYGFPTLLTSKWWLKSFGTDKIFVSCLLLYTMNAAVYSYIYNPWWCLVVDTSIAFTNELFWVAVVIHCWNVAPKGLSATLNAFTGSVHYGMGRSSGVFLGGMLMNYMGPRKAYRIMAAIFFATAILYSCFILKRHGSPSAADKRNAVGITDGKSLEIAGVHNKIKKSSALMKVI